MTNWLPDLTDRPGPRYLALANAIAEAVDQGILKPGTRLPTRRELADRLNISINTISSAYLEAERRGYVTGEVGRGTFVQARKGEPEVGFFLEKRQFDLIDLSVCRPCPSQIHVEATREALGELAKGADFSWMLACRPVIGQTTHRQTMTTWLHRIGMPARLEQVILTNGCAHGMTVALATLTKPGDIVVTEALTDHGLISLASVLHFQLRGLATDEQGILPDAFESACRTGEVKVLVTTPTLNNPTNSLMPDERRRRIAAIATTYGVAIVEDDVFRPLVEDAPPPLSAYAPDNSYHLTSFTKSVMSGLRIGCLVAPEPMVMRLVARVRATSWMATPMAAELATHWINNGGMSELVAFQRQELAARQALVRQRLAGYEFVAHPTGINVWLTLPPPWRADNFVSLARLRGVAITSAEPFVVGRLAQPHAIRISVGTPDSRDQLDSGLIQLNELLSLSSEPVMLNV